MSQDLQYIVYHSKNNDYFEWIKFLQKISYKYRFNQRTLQKIFCRYQKHIFDLYSIHLSVPTTTCINQASGEIDISWSNSACRVQLMARTDGSLHLVYINSNTYEMSIEKLDCSMDYDNKVLEKLLEFSIT